MLRVEQLLKGIAEGDFRSIARAISLVENDASEGMDLLKELKIDRSIPITGITGPPGAGKSTLVNALVELLSQGKKKIAVVAIDPSSPFNFGALLGDRIRMGDHFNRENIYIRSVATRGSLGGISAKTIEISDILRAAPFDHIIIETVGVGQSEVEIAGLADTTVVVMVPEAGDEIQTMKAGVMEIADIFVVNKSDRPDADRFIKDLEAMLHARTHTQWQVPVIKSIASQNIGIRELHEAIKGHGKIEHSSEMQAQLLSQKAFLIIQQHRMKDIDRSILYKEIRRSLDNKDDLNLYRTIEPFL